MLEGDILVNDSCNTATNLTTGSKAAGGTASSGTAAPKVKIDAAQSKDKNLAGTYTVTASALNLRAGAGTDKTILVEMPNGAKVQCYGYYTSVSGVKWLYVVYKDITGFASSKYLKK